MYREEELWGSCDQSSAITLVVYPKEGELTFSLQRPYPVKFQLSKQQCLQHTSVTAVCGLLYFFYLLFSLPHEMI